MSPADSVSKNDAGAAVRHVRQRNGRDCGVAAAAMLAGVPYDVAALAHPGTRPHDGLQAMEVAVMLRRLSGRLVRLSGAVQGRPLAASAHALPDPALVLIHAPDSTRGHYVVVTRHHVLDPELPDSTPVLDYRYAHWTIFRVLTLED